MSLFKLAGVVFVLICWGVVIFSFDKAPTNKAFTQNVSYSQSPIHPSFDCSRASHLGERLVCGDAALADLDVKLSVLYGRARIATSESKELLFGERAWIEARNACTTNACVTALYNTRISELSQVLAEPIQPPISKSVLEAGLEAAGVANRSPDAMADVVKGFPSAVEAAEREIVDGTADSSLSDALASDPTTGASDEGHSLPALTCDSFQLSMAFYTVYQQKPNPTFFTPSVLARMSKIKLEIIYYTKAYAVARYPDYVNGPDKALDPGKTLKLITYIGDYCTQLYRMHTDTSLQNAIDVSITELRPDDH
jgi:uncharacterized protein